MDVLNVNILNVNLRLNLKSYIALKEPSCKVRLNVMLVWHVNSSDLLSAGKF